MTNGGLVPRVVLVAAAALVRDDGRVLVAQRPQHKQHGGLWEFPGGKVEAGETPAMALARELAEELGVTVDPAVVEPVAFASEGPLVLLLHAVRAWAGEPRALEAAALAWVAPGEMAGLAMPPADRPLVEALRGWLACDRSPPGIVGCGAPKA